MHEYCNTVASNAAALFPSPPVRGEGNKAAALEASNTVFFFSFVS